MKTLTISLTRAHRIAERITTELAAARCDASQSLVTLLRTAPSASQVAALERKAEGLEAGLVRHAQLLAGLAVIRKAVGRGNATSGVSDVLCDIDMANREIQLIDAAVQAIETAETALHVSAAVETMFAAGDKPYPGLSVTALHPGRSVALRARKHELERLRFSLNDRLAELNATCTVSVDLDEALLASLGM